MNDFSDLLWENSHEINASMRANLRGRLVLPNINEKLAKQFPPSVKKRKLRDDRGKKAKKAYDIADGIIAHLTRECGGNLHDRHVVDVMSGSFEKEIFGANPDSGAYDNILCYAAKNATDLESDSIFGSACREKEENIPHTGNNWVCYDFKERRIAPTHYTIRTNRNGLGG
jgi:hypothetical protein